MSPIGEKTEAPAGGSGRLFGDCHSRFFAKSCTERREGQESDLGAVARLQDKAAIILGGGRIAGALLPVDGGQSLRIG